MRQAWWELVAEIDPAWLVFLDESGVTTEMTRRYGWGLRWERVREAVPAGHWRTLTISAALTTEGVLASMSIESPTDGDVFLAFIEQVLAPQPQPGHIVILDKLAAHKVEGVRPLIESRGAMVLYLPPYSPDFNPIEQAWSKLKQILRGIKARFLQPLEQALDQAIAAITRQDARAFFATAVMGYSNCENALAICNVSETSGIEAHVQVPPCVDLTTGLFSVIAVRARAVAAIAGHAVRRVGWRTSDSIVMLALASQV
jgi:transposase